MKQQQNSFYSYLLEIPVGAEVGISYAYSQFVVCLLNTFMMVLLLKWQQII